MAQDDGQSKKLKDIEERQNRYLARRVEDWDATDTGQTVKKGEQVPDETEFPADTLCRECAPAADGCSQLATPAAGGQALARGSPIGADTGPSTDVSKGGSAEMEIGKTSAHDQ